MFYISYYTTPDDLRASSPAANAKTISIAKALAETGTEVEILSTCTVAKAGNGFVKGRKFQVSENVTCRQIPFFITGFGPLRRLQYILANIWLFLFLIIFAKKNESVLFYHAVERASVIALAKRIKKFRLVLEVEEVYANASKLSEREIEAEKRDISVADAFIFPTTMLSDAVNKNNKPFAVIHGTYEAEPILTEPLNDGKTHVVYAGTLSKIKGGAYAAAEVATFLDENYHIHILGFGNDAQIAEIKELVNRLSAENKCNVTYDGCLNGEEYSKFIQRCHIGLSTQNPHADFNDTSFPSKILAYMANGLNVVSAKLPVVESSKVNNYIHYYDEQTPEKIAEAIKSAKTTNGVKPREIVESLKEQFKADIKSIL